MSPPLTSKGGLQRAGSLRKKSKSSSKGSASLPDGRRISKARKALNFDAQPSGSSTFRHIDESASFPDQVTGQGRDPPPSEAFWSNPPPLEPNCVPLIPFRIGRRSTLIQRRSERLICKATTSSATKIEPSVCLSDGDSGFEPTPPNSQNVSGTSGSLKVDALSVTSSSDYGTEASEGSYVDSASSSNRELKRRLRSTSSASAFITVKKSRKFDKDCEGYLSDIDEIESPKAEIFPEPWDEDEYANAGSLPSVVLPTVDESESTDWEGILLEEGSHSSSAAYLNISNLSTAQDITVEWINKNGIQTLIPLEGYEFPEGYERPTIPLSPLPPLRLRSRRHRLNNPVVPVSPFQIHRSAGISSESLERSFLKAGIRLILASQVICVDPVGTRFCHLYPAIISVPLEVIPAQGDEVFCLSSNNPFQYEDPTFNWTIINTNFTLKEGRFTFETFELKYFVIVIREGFLEAQKVIRGRIGGNLYLPECPWIEVRFFKGSFQEDTIASVRVFLDTERTLEEHLRLRKSGETEPPLASPILMLQPHGMNFLPDLVEIQVPIPNYEEIKNIFGESASLVIWQSCTGEREDRNWKLLETRQTIKKVKHIGRQTQTVLSFKVSHFSFFRVVWDLISTSLYEARVGMSYFHSFVSFSMKVQANMEEAADNRRFALEVTCFRSDKKYPESSNYRYKVGSSSKPKLVRPGRIFVRLKSSYFEADEEAGESPELVKEESDFRGRDFEVQYCCKFKPDKSIDRGPFGKVLVNRQQSGKLEELLFEVNLQKSGHEGEKTPGSEDRWSIVALQELAAGLFILEGDNWKVFAHHIGFTKNEVKKHFKGSMNPFISMVNMYQHRGGTPDEFVQALYAVNRELKINGAASPTLSRNSRSSTASSGFGSIHSVDKYRSLGSDSDTSGTQISQDSVLSRVPRKRSNPSINRSNGSSSKAKKAKKHSSDDENDGDRDSSDSLRDRNSDEEAPFTSMGETAKSESSSIFRRQDKTKLESSYLWEISSHMEKSSLNWKSLGRNLRLDETVLINIESSHRMSGVRELYYQALLAWREKYPGACTFGSLYSVLRKEGINAVAKAMMTIKRND